MSVYKEVVLLFLNCDMYVFNFSVVVTFLGGEGSSSKLLTTPSLNPGMYDV